MEIEVKALQCTGPNQLVLSKFRKPELEDDSALLKIQLCGICGTDLHGIGGKRTVQFPFIPGHEIVATVDSVGKHANKFIKTFGGSEFKVGDRVTINPRIVCGTCYYCKNFPSRQEMCLNAITGTSIGSGSYPHLFGGWAEYIYLKPGSEIIKLPESLPDELATLVEPFSCAVGCVDRYRRDNEWIFGDGFSISDTVVVIGAGAIGILMIAGFHLAGAKRIIAIDANQERLILAGEFGATDVIDITSTDANERIDRIFALTDGLGAGVVVEACGVPSAITEGVSMLRRGGKLFEVGHLMNSVPAEINPLHICRNEIEILGHYAYPSSQTMLYAAKLLDEHKLPYEKLVSFHKLEDFEEVIFNRRTGGSIKPVFII